MRATVCIVTAPVSASDSVAPVTDRSVFRRPARPRIAPLLDCHVIDNMDIAVWKLSLAG